jgi:hypothetical protein
MVLAWGIFFGFLLFWQITFNLKIIPLQLFFITPTRYIYPLLGSGYIYSPTRLNLSEHRWPGFGQRYRKRLNLYYKKAKCSLMSLMYVGIPRYTFPFDLPKS